MPRAIARVLLAGGGALAQPPECRHTQEKRLEDANAVGMESDIRVLRIIWGGTIPRVTLRSTLGYEHSLRSGIRPFRSCCCVDKRVTISLSEAVFVGEVGTPHRSLCSLCVVLTINQPLRGCAAIIAAEAADFQ